MRWCTSRWRQWLPAIWRSRSHRLPKFVPKYDLGPLYFSDWLSKRYYKLSSTYHRKVFLTAILHHQISSSQPAGIQSLVSHLRTFRICLTDIKIAQIHKCKLDTHNPTVPATPDVWSVGRLMLEMIEPALVVLPNFEVGDTLKLSTPKNWSSEASDFLRNTSTASAHDLIAVCIFDWIMIFNVNENINSMDF